MSILGCSAAYQPLRIQSPASKPKRKPTPIKHVQDQKSNPDRRTLGYA